MWTNIRYYYYWFTVKSTISAHIPCLWLIKELGFYGEILLNKTLSNWQILLNKVLKWRFNQEWRRICADTVVAMKTFFFTFCKILSSLNSIVYVYTVSAQIRGHSWLNRHACILFSKICQLLNVLFSKISP